MESQIGEGVNFYGHPPADPGVGKRRSGKRRKTRSPTIGRPDRLYYGRGIIIIASLVLVWRNEQRLEEQAEKALPGSLDAQLGRLATMTKCVGHGHEKK